MIAASSLIAAAAAVPLAGRDNTTAIPDNTPFGLVALRSASPVHFAPFQALNTGIGLNFADEGADCEIETNTAQFYLANGQLYLYTPEDLWQQVWVDRSGMGQGIIQYSTYPGGFQATRYAETDKWAVDSAGDLNFDGSSLIACPIGGEANTTASYSVWLSTSNASPGGNSNCLGISSRAILAEEPNRCTYSFTPYNSTSS